MVLNTSAVDFGANIRCIRVRMCLSQAEFAKLIRNAGQELGEPNECTKRLVQKWEAGDHGSCRHNYRRAFQFALGISYDHLCTHWPESEKASESQSVLAALESVAGQLTSLMFQVADLRDQLFKGNDIR